METRDHKTGLRDRLHQRLRHPVRLRAFVTACMLLAGYVGIYMPLGGGIAETSRKLTREEKRRDLAHEIVHLRAQVDGFRDRLPAKTDTNEWVQYVLEGIRGFPLKLIALDPAPLQQLGPYRVVVLRIELEASFHDLDAFLNWLASNERFFRVDEVKITPSRRVDGNLVMQLTLLGVMG